MGPCSKEGLQYPGLHEEEHCQQVESGDPSLLLSTGEATPVVLCPGLGSPVSQRDGVPRESSAKGHEDNQGTGAPVL